LGQFIKHLVCSPKSKGLETPFKQAQPPAKTHKQSTQNHGAQSQNGLVPLIEQKIKKKKGGFWVKWVSGYIGEKREI
jgi:trehalose-6-phosphate synthase